MDSENSRSNRVLIVENEPDIRETLAEILELKGYTVSAAANGQEALARLQQRPHPFLIVLDLMMPVMNGWEFRRRQQQDPELADIPVVVVSGDGHVDQDAASVAASAYLRKPIDPDALLDLIAQYQP